METEDYVLNCKGFELAEYSAIDIAKYIISKSNVDKFPVSNLKLQKLLYFVQREFLLKQNKPLFTETIEAWMYGPVVDVVYGTFCGQGADPIKKEFETNIDSSSKEIIDTVLENNISKKPWELVEETHKKGGAWDVIYDNGKGKYQEIPLHLIKKLG